MENDAKTEDVYDDEDDVDICRAQMPLYLLYICYTDDITITYLNMMFTVNCWWQGISLLGQQWNVHTVNTSVIY